MFSVSELKQVLEAEFLLHRLFVIKEDVEKAEEILEEIIE
jgi:Tfp pilus assembly protein FimV